MCSPHLPPTARHQVLSREPSKRSLLTSRDGLFSSFDAEEMLHLFQGYFLSLRIQEEDHKELQNHH
jgi:hypothetical protein